VPDDGGQIDRVDVRTPAGPAWDPLVRIVLGGIATRVGLGFEELDDLQLAVERLRAECAPGEVSISFEVSERSVRTRIGPLRQRALAAALQQDAPAGDLTLRRILDTLVDSFGIEVADDDRLTMRLEKVRRS
jgi:hypothetical protein